MLQHRNLVFASVLSVLLISGFATVLPAFAVAPTIPVGNSPYDIAIDEGSQQIYVANSDDGTISVIDATSNTVINVINDGVLPYGVAVDPVTHLLYVANAGSASVSVIDPTTSLTTSSISVGNVPTGIAVDRAQNHAYVTNTQDGTVSVIDLTTNAVIQTVTVGSSPYGVTVDQNTHKIYVANTNSDSVSVIDPTTFTVTNISLPTGSSPYNSLINPNNNKLYVTDNTADSVSVIDLATNTLGTPISLPSGSIPYGIDMDMSTQLIYVSNFGSSSLSVINPTSNSVTGVIQVGAAPYSIGVDQSTHSIYSANLLDGTVSVIDPTTAQATAITPTIAITSSPSQPIAGQSTALTAALNPAAATGTIQFLVNGTNIGSPVTVTAGVATLTTSSLATGSNDIGAVYVPDNANYTGASNMTTITVKGASSSTTGHVNGEGSIAKDRTFEFDVVSNDGKKINGHLDYDDKSAKIDLDSKIVTSLTIDSTQKSATFAGQAKLNDGKTLNNFLVQVTDPDSKGAHDTFSITIYGSAGNVIYQNSGNVQGHVQIQKKTGDAHGDQDDDHDKHHHHVSSEIWCKLHHHKK